MTPEEIEQKVKEIVSRQFDYPLNEITLEHLLVEDLGADSLDKVEVSFDLEDEFGINIGDKEAEDLKSVGDIVKYVQEHK